MIGGQVVFCEVVSLVVELSEEVNELRKLWELSLEFQWFWQSYVRVHMPGQYWDINITPSTQSTKSITQPCQQRGVERTPTKSTKQSTNLDLMPLDYF
jgi:hypothetical protein